MSTFSSAHALSSRSHRPTPVSAEEKILDSIERNSKHPFVGRQSTRLLIDTEILLGFADPDEVAYAEASNCHSHERFMKSHAEEVPESDCDELRSSHTYDFRDTIDGYECICTAGQVCIKCCTNRDLMGIPAGIVPEKHNVHKKFIGNGFQEVFDLVMCRKDAIKIGLIAA